MLEVQNLTKNYPNFKLDDVTFALPGGVILGLIGENGAGKTTLISAILGLIQPDGGSAAFDGQAIAESKSLREDIGVVFDSINFHESLTPGQIGKICAATYKKWDAALYQSYLARFDLPERQEIKGFSKGMKMKLSIAAALSHHPRLLILDEATGGLDPVMRDDMLDLFLEFVQDDQHSILMSSHITGDLEKIADYIAFLHKGKLLLNKPKDELRYNYGILRCGQAELGKIDPRDMLCLRREPHQTSILVADKIAAKAKYPDILIDNATIDEIMLLYVKGERMQ